MHLKRLKALPLAAEIYRKLGEESEVIQLHVEARDWTEAFRLAEHLPQILPNIHLQYAKWLAESDQFITAHQAYVSAGKPNEASKLLENLADCSIDEQRFLDASYYIYLQAKQVIQFLNSDDTYEVFQSKITKYYSLMRLGSVYYAYNTLDSYLKEPFTSSAPLTLFNTSRFVANAIGNGIPPKGISLFAVLYTLSKQAKVLGANKLHLQVNNKLQNLKPPAGLQDQVDVGLFMSFIKSILFSSYFLYFRLTSYQVEHVREDLMIQKNYYQCVINVRISVHIYMVINVQIVIKNMFFHLFHLVSLKYDT